MWKRTLGTVALAVLIAASAQKFQSVYINGQPVQAIPITVNGKQYLQIAVDDLKKTGALTQGGNTNVTSIQGCKGQTLFNGVLRVTLLEAGPNPNAGDSYKYRVRFRVANGTNKEIGNLVSDARFNYDYVYLASSDGQTVKLNTWEDKETPNRGLIPGGTAFITLKYSDIPSFKLTRVLWRPEVPEDSKLPWAKLKNMEFALDCPQK